MDTGPHRGKKMRCEESEWRTVWAAVGFEQRQPSPAARHLGQGGGQPHGLSNGAGGQKQHCPDNDTSHVKGAVVVAQPHGQFKYKAQVRAGRAVKGKGGRQRAARPVGLVAT